MTILTNRYEILFLYECLDCNPNGDPLDENRPRTDPETGEATVTDVRIKRTIRDYFLAQESDLEKRIAIGKEILIRDTLKSDGYLSEGKDRAEQFLKDTSKGKKGVEKRLALQTTILANCIDARLFGAALPLGEKEVSLQLTGPVQFSAFNRSLHRVTPVMVQQTAAYAGNAKSNQKSFAERWLLPYALIAAYGVVNEVSARTTTMTREDLDCLLEALWKGTASLNTHSKIGHNPLLLVLAQYQPGYQLGVLARRVRISDQRVGDTALRSSDDYTLDISDLLASFKDCTALERLYIAQDARLRCKMNEITGRFLILAEQTSLPAQALTW